MSNVHIHLHVSDIQASLDFYQRFLGERVHFPELVYRNKRLIMGSSMAGEIRSRIEA